jgi:Bacterial Ig domain
MGAPRRGVSRLFLGLSVPSGPPHATGRMMATLTAALAAAVVAGLGLGLSLAISLAHPTPQHSAGTVVPGAEHPGADQVAQAGGSSGVSSVRLVPSSGSVADPGTTLAIPPLSGIMRSVSVTDAGTGAVVKGELSGDATTWHSTTALVAGRSYRVIVASTRSDGVVTVTNTTITAPPG